MEIRNSQRIFCPPINLSYLGISLIWIFILTSLILPTSILAQPTIQWDNTIGGNNWDNLSDLVELPDGSIAYCGITSTSANGDVCLLYTSPSPRDATLSRMPSSA